VKAILESLVASDMSRGTAPFRVEELVKAADSEDVAGRATKLVWMMAANQASVGDKAQIKAVLPKLKAAGLPKTLLNFMTSLI